MNKNNVDLICSVGELAGIFEKSHSLDQFLHQVVSVVAWHMKAAVCSVYLLDRQTDELVLTANQGLNPAAIGKLRINLGTGIVGTAVKELRSIREAHARRNPHFVAIQDLGEERYEAFLAVPILRGSQRVGALVVQDPQPNYFDANDEKALRAIAAQLASTIENATLLLNLHESPKQPPQMDSQRSSSGPKFLRGISCSNGFAQGVSAVLMVTSDNENELFVPGMNGTEEVSVNFPLALARTESQLQHLQKEMESKLADVAALIFGSHLLILKDDQFSGAMQERINNGEKPDVAVKEVVNKFIRLFSASANPVLRQKVLDVMDLARRLLRNLHGGTDEAANYRGSIIVASNLLPSDVLKFSAQEAEGMILVGGGSTSHLSVLARSLNMPMVVIGDQQIFDLPDKTPLLVDADQGTVFINPTPEIVGKYRDLQTAMTQIASTAQPAEKAETITSDGRRVKLMANINLLSDVPVALRLQADGIGLYRSEFPFIVRNDFPSEEEQYRIYSRIVREMNGREVTFRTLDVGGDKALSYFPMVNEGNPFLGLRAIRFSLRYKQFFAPQLRAMLRAGTEGPTRIMFPLVSSVDDFIMVREIVRECIEGLASEGTPCSSNPILGVMVELPAAVEGIEDLAREVGFMSIGSNDLVQYMLAVDRTNERVAEFYQPHHPAVLRALQRVAQTAIQFHRPISICGDMASNPKLIPFLLGIGIHTLSLDPRHIPAVRKAIKGISMQDAEELAARAVRVRRVREIEELFDLRNIDRQ